MRGLGERELLELWELGHERGRHDRALLLTAAARPDLAPDELERIPVAERDAAVLALRERTFGARLAGFAACPQCGSRLELELPADLTATVAQGCASSGELALGSGAAAVRLRRVTAGDLRAAAGAGDVHDARARLAERCVLGEGPVSDELAGAVADRIAELDPVAEIAVPLACPECGHAWRALLDAPDYLWAEIAARARRLLDEVSTLARAHGWSEWEILALGPVRRRMYLERAA